MARYSFLQNNFKGIGKKKKKKKEKKKKAGLLNSFSTIQKS